MKRILFVTSKSVGGSGKYISSLAGALSARGYHCELIYFPLGVPQDAEIESSFAVTHHFRRRPGFSPSSVFANIMQVRKIIKSSKFDWVHTHTSLGGLFGRIGAAWLSNDVKVGHTIHAYGADEFTPVPQRWVYWTIERGLDWLTDAYVSPSRYMVDFGRRTRVINPEKATVIYNSLPLGQLPKDSAKEGRRKRAKFGISSEEVVYLFCGRLERQKGADVLLEALAKIPPHVPWRAVICGAGADESILRARAVGLGVQSRLIWAGWQSNLSSFYAMADIYVMPSRWESFGLVFLEAMNYSLPIVSTRTQAIPEVVVDGETGLLCSVEDADELAAHLLRLTSQPDLRRDLGSAGRSRLDRDFQFSRFVDEHARWYSVDVDSGHSIGRGN